jgi:membrane associated rhomboid family serine protease
MFPLRDLNPTRNRPVVTWSLVAMNVAVFGYEVWLSRVAGGGAVGALFARFGVVADDLLASPDALALVTPITSLFLHADWLHVAGNALFLWVFGDNVEDALGKARFVAFYLLGGLAAAATQLAIDPGSRVPLVGASGAISAVLAGYVVLYPRAPVLTFVPPMFFPIVPAWLFLFAWFALQLVNAFLSIGALRDGEGGVAFFAHVGGFLAGLVTIRLFARGRDLSRAPPREQP